MKHTMDRTALGFWKEKEVRLEAAHLLDLVDTAFEERLPVRTPFLGPGLAQWFEGILQKERVNYQVHGGFPDAERVCCLLGEKREHSDNCPAGIVLLTVISLEAHKGLEHRHILGSLMGLGLKRELIGDIRPGGEGMVVAVVEEIAPFLLQEWHKAGESPIRVERVQGEFHLHDNPGEERRITVASSRIDAVVAASFNLARGVVQEWIIQGKIKRNDLIISKSDTEVKAGDLLSCRGQGRIRLLETCTTRKGRTAWTIQLYRTQKR